jgi:hypothetical protein
MIVFGFGLVYAVRQRPHGQTGFVDPVPRHADEPSRFRGTALTLVRKAEALAKRGLFFNPRTTNHCDPHSEDATMTLDSLSAKVVRREIPIYNVPVRFDKFRPCIAIVDVIRVFPHIDGQQRLGVGGQRRSGIAC